MNERELFETAVKLVRSELSSEFTKLFLSSFRRDHSHDKLLHRSGFGITIRNLLAQNGILWEEVAVCSVWLEILKESIRTFPH